MYQILAKTARGLVDKFRARGFGRRVRFREDNLCIMEQSESYKLKVSSRFPMVKTNLSTMTVRNSACRDHAVSRFPSFNSFCFGNGQH